MLETEIKKLTTAVEANTAALLGGATLPVAKSAPVPAAAAAKTEPAPGATVGDIPVDIPTAEPVAAEPVTLKQITEGIVNLCKAKGRESAAMLMAEYGAQKVPDLKKVSEKYGEILGKINALIESK